MAKPKLHEVVAVVQGKKSRASKMLTAAHRGWNDNAISGISKTYTPKDEDGDQLPPESKNVQLNAVDAVRDMATELTGFYDIVATQEKGNTQASADVEIDGKVVLAQVPVGTLMFLEKQLTDLCTFAEQLPVLPSDREWTFDANRNCYVTQPVVSNRTSKQPRVVVKYEATKEHPAQTELFSEDVVVGTYSTVYMSSAIPVKKKVEVLQRITALQEAVKIAREKANSVDIDKQTIGAKVLGHVFGDILG